MLECNCVKLESKLLSKTFKELAMGAVQVYEDWGVTTEVPTERIDWEELKTRKFRVERWRWVGDRVASGVVLSQSYFYVLVAVDGAYVRFSVCNDPFDHFYSGPAKGFKPWLYKQLRECGMFVPHAFDNLSVFI